MMLIAFRVFILGLCMITQVQAARGLAVVDGATPNDRKVALVIGNNGYQHVTPLEKAGNDAREMGKALEKIGFKTTVVTEAGQRRMNAAINRFVNELSGGGVGVLFFAGHGIQINNQNFLLPTDIENPQEEADVYDQAVSLQGVQEKLAQAKARFALLVIDACRDNPLPKKAGRSIGLTRGLAQPSAPSGQVVLFSAGANQQALDKLDDQDSNPNSLFTRELLPVLQEPGLSVSDALKKVRRAVISKAKGVNHDQHPAIYDQTDGEFYFVSAPQKAAPVATVDPNVAKMMQELADIRRAQADAAVREAAARETAAREAQARDEERKRIAQEIAVREAKARDEERQRTSRELAARDVEQQRLARELEALRRVQADLAAREAAIREAEKSRPASSGPVTQNKPALASLNTAPVVAVPSQQSGSAPVSGARSYVYRVRDAKWGKDNREYLVEHGSELRGDDYFVDGRRLNSDEAKQANKVSLIFGEVRDLPHFDQSFDFLRKKNLQPGDLTTNLPLSALDGLEANAKWGFSLMQYNGKSEKVKVPAGEFEVVVVEYKGTLTGLPTGVLSVPWRTDVKQWFAPALGRWVKQEIVTYNHYLGGTVLDKVVYELTDLRMANLAARQ